MDKIIQQDVSVVKNGWGGPRPNSGRPAGQLLETQKQKLAAKRLFDGMVLSKIEPIVQAQISLATGLSYLYKFIVKKDSDGKQYSESVLVTDPKEINDFLNENMGDPVMMNGKYYMITVQKPDNYAINSLLDRVFGKARQNIGIDGGEEGMPIPILAIVKNVSGNDSDNKDSQSNETD